MDIMELGAIGELVGGVAVIATLIYLTVQIRHARHEVSLAGIQARATTSNSVLRPIVESEELAPIFAKLQVSTGLCDWGLDDAEAERFSAWCHMWMQAEQARFYSLPASAQEAEDALRLWWLSTPWGAEFWEANWAFYDSRFVAHMAELRARVRTDALTPAQIRAGEGR